MTIWIYAQLSPSLALWINQNFEGIEAKSLLALGLRDALDIVIFQEAKCAGVILMSKDEDFVQMLQTFGPHQPLSSLLVGILRTPE